MTPVERNVDVVTTDVKLTVPEAARRLGLAGGEVYQLVFLGELPGAPEKNGAVYIPEDAVTYSANHCERLLTAGAEAIDGEVVIKGQYMMTSQSFHHREAGPVDK